MLANTILINITTTAMAIPVIAPASRKNKTYNYCHSESTNMIIKINSPLLTHVEIEHYFKIKTLILGGMLFMY